MWGYLKDSVNKSTSDLMKDISERFVNDSDSRRNPKYVQHAKTAMTNVVTPSSIPQFTLPPLLTHDSKAHNRSESIENVQVTQFKNGTIEDKKSMKLGSDLVSKSPTDHSHLKKNNHRKQYDQISQNQPGLTLHHLLSIKSGFSTLTESPNTKRKESLFLSPSPSYHLADVLLQGEKSKCNSPSQSSSDSDISRSVSPRSSPSIERLRNKRSGFDSDSTSSCPSTPLQSPTERRKMLSSMMMDEKSHNIKIDSFSKIGNKNLGDSSTGDERRRSNSASSVSRYGVALSLDSSTENKSRLHMIVTYLATQQKLNVSILEADNFALGRAVYLKVSLLPGNHGNHRTDILKTSSSRVDIRERFTFHQVREDEIYLMSLEVSCKEKPGRLRHANSVGKCTLTLCEINVTTSNDLWLELKPPEIEEAPHIQLSLCYHAMLGFVTIEVISVRNVPKGGMGRYQDCYVVLAKQPPDEKSSKKQTKISHRTKDPVFHESFIFSMPHDELVIVATLFCKDKVKGHWSSCGEVKLGQGVETWSGQAQWSQALDREGQPVTFWHLLRL